MSKTQLYLQGVLIVSCLGISTGKAAGDLVPTHGAVVHYDPLAPPNYFAVPPGGAGLPAGNDALVALNELWHWELEFLNPGPPAINLPIRIVLPAPLPAIVGVLALPPATGAIFDIEFDENLLPFIAGDIGGPFFVNVIAGAGVPAHLFGTSVTEDLGVGNIIPLEFTPDPNPSGKVVDIEIVALPEPATLALLALGGAMFTRRRRRRL